jgi:hypothetical protein
MLPVPYPAAKLADPMSNMQQVVIVTHLCTSDLTVCSDMSSSKRVTSSGSIRTWATSCPEWWSTSAGELRLQQLRQTFPDRCVCLCISGDRRHIFVSDDCSRGCDSGKKTLVLIFSHSSFYDMIISMMFNDPPKSCPNFGSKMHPLLCCDNNVISDEDEGVKS